MNYNTSRIDKIDGIDQLLTLINHHVETAKKAYECIQQFKKLIVDHLDPSCRDIDILNTPIHLDEIDHHLHPQIQEILTNNFALRQQKQQTFEEIVSMIYSISKQNEDLTQLELQNYFIKKNLPVYLIPVVPSMTFMKFGNNENHSFIWGNQKKNYKLSVAITPYKKYLNEILEQYGFGTFEETLEYVNLCGFVSDTK
jgi:hypothetical protein